MENQRQRWVNLIFAGCGMLVAYATLIGMQKITAVYNLESTVKQIDLIIRLVSLALGLIVGFGFYLNDKSNAFMNEVIIEIVKVTWPTPNDTSKATIMVVIMVLISGFVLGFFDWVVTGIMKAIL